MGILLKGLSLKAIPDDEYMVVRIWNNGSISTAACSYGVNHGEKRAFEVPTPHDALIDVSELYPDTEWSEREDDFTAYSRYQISSAPTVVEAEE